MAMYGGSRDVSLIRGLNRELLHNIVTQQAAFYKFKLEETKTNLYGEASGEKYYDGPFLFNCLIDRQDQSYPESDEGINFSQGISFAFLRDDLKDAEVVPEVGDIILYQNGYYGVQATVANQYFVGKNPSYPNKGSDGSANPLNPGLENFGANLSIICETYYIPSDKVAISPFKERF
ncbi:hypothetical protein N9Z86_00735 [bacterium]|nr:hypothetical protein [bacterium]|tara:strand:+ start:4609 stop:5139 length:531 start_codon:yes stop_codon:yes gene_type:complete